jgi:DNA helicase-2/ATP-dependent DNA helicase PcrA
MDVSYLLDELNAAQRDAVAAEPGNILVLAGAGSGKTRVLVQRIAWQIQTGQASPHGILAVTFTNKAAAEMRGRIGELLEMPIGGMWVGTFHSTAHRLLRMHYEDARLPREFQIIDSDDQNRLLKRVIRSLDLDEAQWPAKEAQWFINARKDEGLRAEHLDSDGEPGYEQPLRIYRAYEEACRRSGLVDFAELLLRAHELWRDNPAILEHYRNRFKFILVDEFQDTNAIQYGWLRMLAGKTGKLFVVGDDDQSIYSWRGARIENMHRFQTDFSDALLLRLEQNYRSTSTILNAANALISNNPSRLGKNLWTADDEGDPISLYAAFNEYDEARFCVDQMVGFHDGGQRYDDMAVLYRVSAQSRVFEDALRQADIPYRVHGGFRFYERAEVKDALSYLRLCIYRNNDTAFERVVNRPTRGIGQRTVVTLREIARTYDCSLWEAALRAITEKSLAARAIGALHAFVSLINSTAEGISELPLGEGMDHVIGRSGLPEFYKKEKSERALDRVENLEELVSAAQEFELHYQPDDDLEPVAAYLAHAALEAGEGQADKFDDCIQLMTLHSAKGLEYPNVFLVGVEEGLFPHQRSSQDAAQLEEERRLCYVGLTRAKQRLIISYAESRRLHGTEYYPQPSRFIREIPSELIREVRLGGAVEQMVSFADGGPGNGGSIDDEGLRLGQRVMHGKFGEGVVLNLEGHGNASRVQVNFKISGAKWLVTQYAGLQVL